MAFLAVAIGSAIGGTGRYWLSGLLWTATAFPFATLFINVLGSFLIAFGATVLNTKGQPVLAENWRVFFMVGLCGGFTTFSTFSLETVALMQEGRYAWALAYTLASVGFCLSGVALGFVCAKATNLYLLPLFAR